MDTALPRCTELEYIINHLRQEAATKGREERNLGAHAEGAGSIMLACLLTPVENATILCSCRKGKVQLEVLPPPSPELLDRAAQDAHYMANIYAHNAALQMAAPSATIKAGSIGG